MRCVVYIIYIGCMAVGLSQSILNNSYHASDLVREMHQLPHWNRHLEPVDSTFSITTDSSWNSYTESVVVFPSIIGAAFLIAVVAFQVGLLCRCCFKSCSCHPQDRHASSDRPDSTMRLYNGIKTSRRRCKFCFFFVLCIIIVADQGIFSAKYHMNHGVKTAKDSIDFFHDTFMVLENTGYELEDSGDEIFEQVNASTSTCQQASALLPYIESYEEYIDSYINYVEPIPDNAQDLKHTVYEYGIVSLNLIVFSFYAGVLFLLLLFVIVYFYKSEGGMKATVGVSQVIVLGLIISMMTADFCMEPTDNALSIAPDESIDVITYYATCNGTNPLQEPLSDAYSTVIMLNNTITTLTEPGGDCEGNSYLISCYEDINDILGNLTMIAETAACPPIQDEWANIFNEAVCDSGFYGMLSFWVIQLACMIFLFVLMIVACFVYFYFGIYGEMTPNDVHRQEQRFRLLDHRVCASDSGVTMHGTPVVATAVATAPPMPNEPIYITDAVAAPYHELNP